MKISKIMDMYYNKIEEHQKAMSVCPLFCGFMHMAFVVCNANVHIFGYNHFRGTGQTIHAEISLMKKLKKVNKNMKIDILVIRINRNGTLGMSKPCKNCIEIMNNIAYTKGYIIDKVYFSNYDGEITCLKFTTLKEEKNKHISKYFKNKELKEWYCWSK